MASESDDPADCTLTRRSRSASRSDSHALGSGRRLVDSRMVSVKVAREIAFQPIRRIGGAEGYYYADWLWWLRGLLDRLVGGVGLSRGSQADTLKVGDMVDFWRVEVLQPNRCLRLVAEMKLPGRAWLQFDVDGDGVASTIRQTAIFDPRGVWGLVYWYGSYPVHQLVFAGMLRGIARAAESRRPDDPRLPSS